MNTSELDARALDYAERYGIINYKIKGIYMVYNVSYPAYLGNPHYTIQHKVNLVNGQETTKYLARYDKNGVVNRG